MSEFISDIAQASGASFLGPLGAAAGDALSAVADIADAAGLTRFMSTPAVKAQVDAAVATVTGTTDPAAAGQVLARDHDAATALAAQLAQIAAKLQTGEDATRVATIQAQLTDAANARAQKLALGAQRSWLAAWPAAVTVLLLALWAAILLGFARGATEADRNLMQNVVVMAVSYWLGSSAGSADKTQKLAAAQAISPAR